MFLIRVTLFLLTATKLRQGNVFTPVCYSVHMGVSATHPSGKTPPGQTPHPTPLGRHCPGKAPTTPNPLPGQTPPGRHPHADNPWQTPPGQTTPLGIHPFWADTHPLPCPLPAKIHTSPPAQCMLGYTPPVHSVCWDTVNKQAVRFPLECILVTVTM